MELNKTLKAATGIEKVRIAMKDLYGAEYPEKTRLYKEIIKAHMLLHKQNNFLFAATDISTDEKLKNKPGSQMMFIASAADLIEEDIKLTHTI